MDREIKFRAWDKKNKFLRIDFHIYANNADIGMLFVSNHEMPFYKEMDNEDYILMQYTGLKDKNGKEIYEGDILENRFPHLERKSIIIKWDINCFNTPRISWQWEIVGNIYESPELLED